MIALINAAPPPHAWVNNPLAPLMNIGIRPLMTLQPRNIRSHFPHPPLHVWGLHPSSRCDSRVSERKTWDALYHGIVQQYILTGVSLKIALGSIVISAQCRTVEKRFTQNRSMNYSSNNTTVGMLLQLKSWTSIQGRPLLLFPENILKNKILGILC